MSHNKWKLPITPLNTPFMPTSLHTLPLFAFMELRQNHCKDIQNVPPNPQLSYSFSITMRQPKLRIRIPKLLANTIQRSNDRKHCQAKKTSKADSSSSGVLSHSSLKGQCQPVAPAQSKVSGRHAFKKLFEIEDKCGEEGQKRLKIKKRGKRTSTTDESPKGSFSFSGLCHKLSFIKAIINSTNCRCNSRNMQNTRANSIGNAANANAFGTNDHIVTEGPRNVGDSSKGFSSAHVSSGRQANSSELPRVSSKILIADRKMSSSQIVRTKSERVREGGGEELCKKRILMGGRCRPLNLYGFLRYDQDGILLPDIIP